MDGNYDVNIPFKSSKTNLIWNYHKPPVNQRFGPLCQFSGLLGETAEDGLGAQGNVARSIQIRPGIFVGPTVNLWKGVSFPEND
jgi:hypothetical protein